MCLCSLVAEGSKEKKINPNEPYKILWLIGDIGTSTTELIGDYDNYQAAMIMRCGIGYILMVQILKIQNPCGKYLDRFIWRAFILIFKKRDRTSKCHCGMPFPRTF